MANSGDEVNSASSCKKENPPGILRLDSSKGRRPSVDQKLLLQKEPGSPQPSVLSVTFAEDSLKSDSKTINYSSPVVVKMDKVHFPEGTDDKEESDEEDYSASVNAIILRRASTRKSRRRGRRASSPFSPDILPPGTENGLRRSSVYTTSSGDTAITIDENLANEVTQEEIFENIKLHKEVLSNVKMQGINMKKKLKLVVQAKNYIKKHEGALQERLAQSHSTRDILARWKIYFIKKWQRYRREITNLSNWFIPWELKIKEIESHFGSVVASYFTFLRWLLWVNIVLAAVLLSFVTIPEWFTADPNAASDRKFILKEEKYNATNFLTLWDFEGIFKYSPLFYGWYTNKDSNAKGYRLPFAYFVTGLVLYAYSFFATLRKMAANSRMSKLSEKDDECIFSWKLFTAWDYMIGNAETAHNRVASIVMGFKEALLEEAEKKRQSRNWKVICFRVLVNTIVLGLLSFSAFAVIKVVERSKEPDSTSTVWRRNEITVVLSLISLLFPMLFEVLGFLEQYHPRKQLRLQLARIMVLNLLNLYSLILALIDKIHDMTKEYEKFTNSTQNSSLLLPTIPSITTNTQLLTNCNDNGFDNQLIVPNLIATIASAVTVAAYPLLSDALIKQYNNKSIIETNYESTTDPVTTTFFNTTLPIEYNLTTEDNDWNYTTFINSSHFNESIMYDKEIQDIFSDYLLYILSQFSILTNNITDVAIFNSSLNLSSTIPSTEETVYNDITYDYFKSTTIPYLNLTTEDDYYYDERFDNELTTIYDEITTTLSTFQNNLTTNCTIIRDNTTIISLNEYYFTSPLTPYELKEINLNYSTKSRLRSLCWETMFGQELIKLTVMDLIMTVLSTIAIDFIRGLFVRIMNRCWCWDLEKKFPQYGDFKVAENILHLVNNQGMVWMGMFFSPGLVVLNVVKLYVMMYLRAWAVLTCNVPPEVIFRASRSNNFYYGLLLMMLFLCVLPVGYAIVRIKPSDHCGPFSGHQRIFTIFTKTIKNAVPKPIEEILDYIASAGIIIPLLVLLIVVIYYLISLTNALREANNDLKEQLRRERTEERRKMFQMVDKRRRVGSGGSEEFSNTPFANWKKLIKNMPVGKSFDETPRQESTEFPNPLPTKQDNNKTKIFFSRFIKKALGKSSTSDDDNQAADDGTDTEQHESLPEDLVSIKEIKVHHPRKSSINSGGSFQKIVHTAVNQHRQNSLRNNTTESDSPPPKYSQRRDTFDLKNKFNRNHHPSTSRQDSSSSVWSDNIPVIKISKTDSVEGMLNEESSCQSQNKKEENKDIEEKIKRIDVKQQTKLQTQLPLVITEQPQKKYKPKIKYTLKKQSAEVDEDMIFHFNKEFSDQTTSRLEPELEEDEDLRKEKPKGWQEEISTKFDDNLTEKSSSDDTMKESSVDTVLSLGEKMSESGFKKVDDESELRENASLCTQKSSTDGSSTQTESSYGYKDNI